MIDVLWLAGTFNPNGEGISDDFLKRLDPKRFRYRYVPYPADYGRDMSYSESIRLGELALDRAVRECPGAVVVGGYSSRGGVGTTAATGPKQGVGSAGTRRMAVTPTLTLPKG